MVTRYFVLYRYVSPTLKSSSNYFCVMAMSIVSARRKVVLCYVMAGATAAESARRESMCLQFIWLFTSSSSF